MPRHAIPTLASLIKRCANSRDKFRAPSHPPAPLVSAGSARWQQASVTNREGSNAEAYRYPSDAPVQGDPDAGLVFLPRKLQRAAAVKVVNPLLENGLLKEVLSQADMSARQSDETTGQYCGLLITDAGRRYEYR